MMKIKQSFYGSAESIMSLLPHSRYQMILFLINLWTSKDTRRQSRGIPTGHCTPAHRTPRPCTYNEILCSETFDRAWTIRVSLYRPQTVLSERGEPETGPGRLSRSIGKSNMRPVNTANSLDQHIRGLI